MSKGLFRVARWLFGIVILLVPVQTLADWPDRMPALGPEAAQRVMNLLDPTQADAEVGEGFRTEGVSVSLDSIEVILVDKSKAECRLSVGSPKEGLVPRKTLGGVHVRWQCSDRVDSAVSDRLFDACTAALLANDGLESILVGDAVVVVAGGGEPPEVVSAAREDPERILLYQILVALMCVALSLWAALGALATTRARLDVVWAAVSSAAALLVPRIGHPLYEGLLWQRGITPWDTTKEEFGQWLQRRPEAVPDWTMGHEWGVSLALAILLMVCLSEMVRRAHPEGKIHRWFPALLGLALPMNHIWSGGSWSLVYTLGFTGMAASVVPVADAVHPLQAGILARFPAAATGRARFVLGGLGAVVVLYHVGGAWAGFGAGVLGLLWVTLQAKWSEFRKRVGLEVPMLLCVVAASVLMYVGGSNWSAVPADLAGSGFPDALWEGAPLLVVLSLMAAGVLKLLLRKSLLSVMTIGFACAGALFAVLNAQTLGPASVLCALPGSVILVAVGVGAGPGIVADGPKFWVLLGLLGLCLQHHLFQLFARLKGF